MKTSLDHLPLSKQEQLQAIAALLQAEAEVEMIVLFGSYARGDWVEDVEHGYISDYDLLVVVRGEAQARPSAAWTELWEKARHLSGRVPVSPIVHDLKQLNKEIRTGQYFFTDILREGVALYDARRITLATPRALTPEQRLSSARYNFRYWFSSAGGFWVMAGHCITRDYLAESAFLFHQTAERYFTAALLVLTGYKSKTHDLRELATTAAPLHAELAGALPRTEKEDEHLFELLRKAYIEARYSKSYAITREELQQLRERTYDLGLRVHRAAAEVMATFCGPDAVGELPEPPSPDDMGELPDMPRLDDPLAFERRSRQGPRRARTHRSPSSQRRPRRFLFGSRRRAGV